MLVLDIHWAFPYLTRNKNKHENSGISSSLFLGLQHIWCVLVGQFQDLELESWWQHVNFHGSLVPAPNWGGRGSENKLATLYSCSVCVTCQICFKQTARAVVQHPAFNMAAISRANKPLSAEHTPGIRLTLIKI